MIRTPIFWERELKAPILNLNFNYISLSNAEEIIERAETWISHLNIDKNNEKITLISIDTPDEENSSIHRILRHDVERTFLYPPHRKLLFDVLNTLHSLNQDYAQGMSFVTSFLLLFFESEKTLQIVYHLSNDSKYFKGYWKVEAIPCAIDCYLSSTLLIDKFDTDQEISKHLMERGIIPNAFAQKWFSGLCLHVLPFESLIYFFERIMEEGFIFVFKFAISFLLELKEDLMKSNDISTLFGYLRLDKLYFKNRDINDISKRILDGINRQEISDLFPTFDFESLREQTYNQFLKPSIDRSRAAMNSDSDSEDDEDEDEDDEEDVEEEDNSNDEKEK